jgi:hypothetical protein
VTIKFRFPGKAVEYTFKETQTIEEVIAKLKEADISPEAAVTLSSPALPPITDLSKTLSESGIKGRSLLNVQVVV